MQINSPLEKGLVVGIIMLFFGASVIPSTGSNVVVEKSSMPTFDGNTLYVGGSGPGNYSSIQDAIDNATDGDTVFVYNGTYNERINMKAGVIVQGENTVTTIIDGDSGGTVVKFSNDVNTKLDGFTIRNAGFGYRAGIYCTGCSPMITNNIITSNGKGIFCGYSAAPIITNNIISNNGGAGIDCKFSAAPTITNNIVDNNFWGIYCSDSSAAIINNSVSNNEATGITCLESPSLTITNNTISGNGNVGILCYNTSASITDNEISGNVNGIECVPELIFGPYGTEVICSDSFPEIIDNTITNNDKGIYCEYSSALIKDNEINSNNDGIYCDFLSYGWYCFAESLIYHNDFFDNTRNAYDNSYGNQWDDSSEGNYWDDYTGVDEDPEDGIGDTPYLIPGGTNQDNFPLMETWSDDDTTPPVTTIEFGEPYYKDSEGNIYITSDTPIYLNATDNESGVNATYYKINEGDWVKYVAPFSIPDDCNHAIYFYSVDNAGNEESIKNKNVSVDNYPPYPVIPLPDGENGWFVSSVIITFADAKSDVIYVQYRINGGSWLVYCEPIFISSDGWYTIDYYAIDTVGNDGTGSFSIKIDQTPPTTTTEFDGMMGENDWLVSDVMIILNAEDETSGVDYTMYKVDDGEWITYIAPFNVREDGMHTLCYYSVDFAGNVEDVNVAEFKIDQTLPTISLTAEKIDCNTWLLIADVSDETSGVAKVEFYLNDELLGNVTESPYTWEVSERGTAQAIVYDNAGNMAIRVIDAFSQSQSQSQSSSNSVPVQRRISWICLGGLTGIQNTQRRV